MVDSKFATGSPDLESVKLDGVSQPMAALDQKSKKNMALGNELNINAAKFGIGGAALTMVALAAVPTLLPVALGITAVAAGLALAGEAMEYVGKKQEAQSQNTARNKPEKKMDI